MDRIRQYSKNIVMRLSAVLIGLSLQACLYAQNTIPTPEQFFGFRVGADGKLFGWKQLTDYFTILDEESEHLNLQELGASTLGKKIFMAIISSPTNLKNLAKYRNLQKQAANPRALSEEDARQLAKINKAVIMLLLDSNDLASAQASVELAYLLSTQNTPDIDNILKKTIILLIPSVNPDGLERTVWWYNQFFNTKHRGSPPPYLSHNYAGSEHLFDWLSSNLRETTLLLEQIYQNWFPEIIFQQQSTATNDARQILLTPKHALASSIHPWLTDSINGFNNAIVSRMRKLNLKGVVKRTAETGWYGDTAVLDFWLHNIVAISSKNAPVQMATPLYFPVGGAREKTTDEIRLVDEWPGGWWRLRDVIDYQLATILAVLEHTAENKQRLIYDFCKMNLDAIERGKSKAPFAFVVPQSQHDAHAAREMLKKLNRSGVEIHRAEQDFRIGAKQFKKGDYVLLLAQPFREHILNLMQQKINRYFTESNGSSLPVSDYPILPNLPQLMSVRTFRIDNPFEVQLSRVDRITPTQTHGRSGNGHYIIRNQSNQSAKLVNALLKEDKKLFWLKDPQAIGGSSYVQGSFYLPENEIKESIMTQLSHQFEIEVARIPLSFANKNAYRLKPVKVGLYQPWTANIDEGWTRLVLEKYGFSYQIIHNAKMIQGNYKGDFDAMILSDMPANEIINGRKILRPNIYTPRMPKSYDGGIGSKGLENLREFVEKGGTLIVLNQACDLIIDEFGLPVENVLRNVDKDELFGPGSLLEINVHLEEPIAFGMPERTMALFSNSPAFRPFSWTRRTGVIVSYSTAVNDTAHGKLRGMAAALDIPVSKGRVVLFGFKVQGRAQTEATFKLLFNAIYLARAEETVLEN